MKYFVLFLLAGLLSSSLAFAQARRHYGHELPIIAGASAQNPIRTSGKGHDAIQESRDKDWNPTGNPQCNGIVHAIAQVNSERYTVIGGEFDSIGGIRARSIVATSGEFKDSLQELGGGTDGVIYAICAINDTDIYVAGNFKYVGAVAANNIAHWNGSSWDTLTTGTDSSVLALTLVGDLLYVGGNFRTAGGLPTNYIANWDRKNKNWAPIFSKGVNGVDGGVAALATDVDGIVYVGGGFLTAGLDTVNKIVAIDKGWKSLRGGVTGPNSFVAAITPHDISSSISVGGSFQKADTVTALNIAEFEFGTGWSTDGFPSVNGTVYAISNPQATGSTLIGGDFTEADGESRNHITDNFLHSSGFSFFGSGVDGPVYALAGHIIPVAFQLTPNQILVGGDFQKAGLKPSPFFATFSSSFGAVKETADQLNTFRVYPNPASTEITIENSESITDVTLVDALGRSVLTATPNRSNSPISISTIPDGFYTAMITSNGNIYSRKFIIEH